MPEIQNILCFYRMISGYFLCVVRRHVTRNYQDHSKHVDGVYKLLVKAIFRVGTSVKMQR